MVVLNKHSFTLPRVEKEKFIRLLKLGLEYNRDQGSYSIGSYNKIEELIDTISSILNGEEVMFLQRCILCGNDFPCFDCKYADFCTTKDLPFQCVCQRCLKEGRPYQERAENKG